MTRKPLGLAPAPEEGEILAPRAAPPVAFRVRPGQSGNARGRPRRSNPVAALVAKALAEKVEAKENGRIRHITKLEAVLTQLVNRAANGDQSAAKFVLSLLPDDPGPAPPRETEFTSEGDEMVIAEVVRRLSRPLE